MVEQTIRCPNCGSRIPLTEALSRQIKESVRKEFEAKAKAREDELAVVEEGLRKRASELEAAKQSMQADVDRRVALERAKLQQEADKRAKESIAMELKDLKDENAEKARQLEAARKAELELRRRSRELEEEKKNLDLEVARTLDREREKIRQDALNLFSESHRMKDLEKDKQLSDMRKTIEELRRKSEQGSMQTQGEVGELDLEEMLRAKFPVDVIEPVPKGIRGADIIQKVYTRTGLMCGSVVWEAKRTKAWNDEWIVKLKDDQREVKAEVAVIVTETMPRGLSGFGQVEGVWVTSFTLAGCLAEALRMGIVQVAQSRTSVVGKGEKMEAIYNYLAGAEFKQKIEGIVEAFKAMKSDLEKEKIAMMRLWAKREKQIDRVVTNTARMYGDMQGIIGATLPEISTFELESGSEEDDEENDTLF